MKKLFLLILMGLFSVLSGQEKTVNGQIIIDFEDYSPKGIKITNSRTNITHITDLTGSFSVKVLEGDVLRIQSDFYENRNLLITGVILEKDFLTVHLNLQPVQLDEAIISRKMTGYLDEDAKFNIKDDKLTKLYKDLGINYDANTENARDTSRFSLGKDVSLFHFNVDKAFEALTGQLKMRRELYEYEGREAKIVNIHEYLGDHYFVNDLKIPEEKIREFIFYSYETSLIPMYYSDRNYLAIMIELAKKAPEYLNRSQPEKKEEPIKSNVLRD